LYKENEFSANLELCNCYWNTQCERDLLQGEYGVIVAWPACFSCEERELPRYRSTKREVVLEDEPGGSLRLTVRME